MSKLSINKLIAQDIINVGMNETLSTNYTIYLDEYLKEYDFESQEYIKNNIDNIIDCISKSKMVSDLEIIDNETKELDMIFYWEFLYDRLESIIDDKSRKLDINMDFNTIKEVTENLINDESFEDLIQSKLEKYSVYEM